jgi:hypothetical protein
MTADLVGKEAGGKYYAETIETHFASDRESPPVAGADDLTVAAPSIRPSSPSVDPLQLRF